MIKVTYINQIPTGVVRATAAQVFFLTLLGISLNQPWIVLFITVDFARSDFYRISKSFKK